ncbi:TIGR00730 family Rossman fold protein [Rhodobaculum claviforme]|uniref:Cytokinin riboside 5'-monophosphate phosphoribohydrolase n=1 Tax=Rhodobaculum claviforme TaxID=1549854 RepID=A0A934TMV4_9RHOB|nr:TIGR00730 family Rossman fold protein [Rhodobaculum claviforme]MBK5927948.1 Rossman fold protein, TIGR00730 family [Rhodobaculum claviforme]
MTPSQRSVCVFCGARNGAQPAYAQAARALGALLAAEGWRLVYGAGDVGLMGEVARAASGAGAGTLGVIPLHLLTRERGQTAPTAARSWAGPDVVVTETMHERKKVMFVNSDAVVVLPGGAGSLDEFFEVLTWRQLGLHAKPIFLLDIDGYWAPLMALLEHVVAHGFAEASLLEFVQPVPDVDTLARALRAALG